MKKNIIVVLLLLSFINLFAQVGIGTTDPKVTLDINGDPTLTALPDGLLLPRISRSQLIDKTGYGTDQIGVIIYVTDLSGTNNTQTVNVTEIGYYYFDGTIWEKLNKNLEITYEALALSDGNQTLTVQNADKIVGFTLISSVQSLNHGRMSGTWMIGDERETIRCHMQSFEHPFIKMLGISVQIDNTANSIAFTNYLSRFWEVTEVVPQNDLNTDGTNYRLGKIVIIRKE